MGVCCVDDVCYEVVFDVVCNVMGGLLYFSTVCAQVLCGGAVEVVCCLGDDCLVLSIDDCFGAGGQV